MSDSDSPDRAPRRTSRRRWGESSARFPADFPLNPNASFGQAEVIGPITAEVSDDASTQLVAQQGLVGFGTAGGVRDNNTNMESYTLLFGDSPVDEATWQRVMARSTIANKKEKKEPLKPITTLVSALPETIYKDQEDTKGSEKTLPYLKVQRMLLRFLATHAADSLTPLQARRLTEAIEPRTKKPTAEEALRLCYYMRSQGVDTYAKLKKGTINLFVVDQRFHVRDVRHDYLYWKQYFKTNTIEYLAPDPNGGGGMRAADARRNALPPFQGTLASFGSMIEDMSRRHVARDAAENAVQAGEQDENAAPSAAAATSAAAEPGQQEQQQPPPPIALEVRVADAEAALHRLLNSETQDATDVTLAVLSIMLFRTNLSQGH